MARSLSKQSIPHPVPGTFLLLRVKWLRIPGWGWRACSGSLIWSPLYLLWDPPKAHRLHLLPSVIPFLVRVLVLSLPFSICLLLP